MQHMVPAQFDTCQVVYYMQIIQPDKVARLRNRTAEISDYASGHPVIQPVAQLRPVMQPDKLHICA